MEIKVGISNRHIHLKKEDLEILFGVGYELSMYKKLNQTNQYASYDKVTIKTDKGEISSVRVLGPVRSYTQVEISKTDAFKLGINPPVRTSGDLENSSPIIIVGPKGILSLNEGCIISNRHIHITPSQMEELGLNDVEEVCLKVDGIRGGILEHVRLKVDENAYFEAHLDTDDANAHLINDGDILEIINKKAL